VNPVLLVSDVNVSQVGINGESYLKVNSKYLKAFDFDVTKLQAAETLVVAKNVALELLLNPTSKNKALLDFIVKNQERVQFVNVDMFYDK